MRIISIFAFILVSTSLLSESYNHAEAIGIDEASHGSLYGGKVVRRYGAGRFIYRGLQRRAEPAPKEVQDNKAPNPKGDNQAPKDPKDPKDPKNLDPPKAQPKENNNPPKAQPKENNNPPKAKEQNPPKNQDPPKVPKDPKDQVPKDPSTPKVPNVKVPAQKNDKAADDTTDNTLSKDDQDQSAEQEANVGVPTVSTGTLTAPAIGGLAAVGGVFILVGGLFAFSQKRKNNEITKSIVSTSAKAWEQQNSAYEILEEESKPIGSFTVIATYTPNLADELDIQPGDKVTILVEYDDGWVQGINETRGGIKGVFPRHCVDMNRTSDKVNKNNKRSSSMGGYTTEKYTEVDLS